MTANFFITEHGITTYDEVIISKRFIMNNIVYCSRSFGERFKI
jgi:hypothetical protein